MTKKALRRELLARRCSLDQAACQVAGTAAQRRLAGLDVFRRAACIALYAPVQHEIETGLLFLEARSSGKRVLYPAVCDDTLQFREVTEPEQLTAGAYGILEPCGLGKTDVPATADLIIIPGLAFDLLGHRIGFGKGYYDRYLSQLAIPAILVGLCHDFQLLDTIPSEAHDVRMQYLVTDKRLIIPTGDESRNRLKAGLT
jgi:5-formyltetrahydrofolate cyclo-ligase